MLKRKHIPLHIESHSASKSSNPVNFPKVYISRALKTKHKLLPPFSRLQPCHPHQSYLPEPFLEHKQMTPKLNYCISCQVSHKNTTSNVN